MAVSSRGAGTVVAMLHVIEAGEGDVPIVLLHGFGTGARGWRPQLETLSGKRLVLAPDLPGFGSSAGPFSLARACAEIVELLDDRGLGLVDLCGLSLGAVVALELALCHGEQVRRIVLCCGFLSLPEVIRAGQQEMAASLRTMPPEAASGVVADLVAGVPEPDRAAAVEDLGGLAPADFAAIVDEVNSFDRTAEIEAVALPALVCCGDRDASNIPLSRDLAVGLKTHLHLVPDAGHVANLDAADAFTALVQHADELTG